MPQISPNNTEEIKDVKTPFQGIPEMSLCRDPSSDEQSAQPSERPQPSGVRQIKRRQRMTK